MTDADIATASPPSATARPPLRRSSPRVLGGVARGLAEHTGLDALVFRIGFVGLSFVGGLGVVVYLLAWIFIPSEQGKPFGSLVRSLPRFVVIIAALIAAILLATEIDIFASGIGNWKVGFFAFVLIVIGVLLLGDDPHPTTDDAQGIEAGRWSRFRIKRRHERSPLPWLAIAGALLAIGLIGLADNLGIGSLPPGRYPAIALTTFGVALLISARYGRARSLLLAGLLLLPVAFVASPIDLPLRGRLASVYERPRTVEELEARYDVLMGDVVIDLSQLRRPELSEDIDLEINAVAGRVTAYVPEWMDLSVDGSIDLGTYELPGGSNESGVDLAFSHDAEGTKGEGSVDLAIRGGAASVRVFSLGPNRIWASEVQRLRRQAQRARLHAAREIRRQRAEARRDKLQEVRELQQELTSRLEELKQELRQIKRRRGGGRSG